MSRLAYIIAAGVLPGTLGLALAQGALTPKRAHLAAAASSICEVRTTKVPGGVELEAVVSGLRALDGSYSFVIEKRGSAGDSDIAQAGEFSVEHAAEQVLGSAGLGLSRGDSYTARLVLTDGSGDIVCEAEDDTN
jgi:hypothetical protein